MQINDAVLTLLGTIFGGAGLKYTDWLLNKSKRQQEQAAGMRNDLREEISSLKQEVATYKINIRELQTELDTWRAKYYDLRDEFTQQTTALSIALEKLKEATGNGGQ